MLKDGTNMLHYTVTASLTKTKQHHILLLLSRYLSKSLQLLSRSGKIRNYLDYFAENNDREYYSIILRIANCRSVSVLTTLRPIRFE